MDISECTRFAMENPLTYIATVEGNQPRVRPFAMWFADKSGFYYHTGIPKKVWRQLQENPGVELCFYSPNAPGAGKMLRVSGTVEFLKDAVLQERLFRDRPWLKAIIREDQVDAHLAIFRIAHGEARFWTMEYNMREQEAPEVRF
jgi:uncharacterized pyridoxamine 5'-phosphate oxidase family protein